MEINEPIWALGAMSGTSLDGVDAAMVLTDGVQLYEFGDSAYRPYSAAEQAVLRSALGKWPGAPGVSEAARVVEEAHLDLLGGFDGAQLIGFHGQTLAHDTLARDPGAHRTHQTGDGARLASALGVPVVWDMRSADVAAGGQGAPLASFYHYACAAYIGVKQPVAFLNLGGVGNMTFVDPGVPVETALIAFDTGPANAPLNDLMQARRGVALDRDGALAAQGQVDADVVVRFLKAPYFTQRPPKSLDRDSFANVLPMVDHLADADAAATLLACSAAAASIALSHLRTKPEVILLCGGGRKNTFFIKALSDVINVPICDVDEAGLNGDMLEAQAFAYLAVRSIRGLALTAPMTTGVSHPITGGRLSQA